MIDDMTEKESLERGICDIAGCTSASVSSRWVVLDGAERHIEVCWKHAEGTLDDVVISPTSG
jgi:hypothetical protein